MLKRVVITGMGCVAPLGTNLAGVVAGIEAGRSAVRRMEGWEQYIGLRSLVGAPVEGVDDKDIPRKARRTMSRMSVFAVKATQQAMADAGLQADAAGNDRLGCVIGSTMGSASSINDAFETMLPSRDLSNMTSSQFFRCISHTAVMNVSQYLGITGTVMAPAAACASGLQAVGVGFDLIRLGKQDVVLCGGAEELHPTVTGSFDVLFATSTRFNDEPRRTPRPFDAERDGLVCGEGSGILCLEEYEHARRRNARILAEVTGYFTCGSGEHVSQSNCDAMSRCMREAMRDARVTPADIHYVNAHATGTPQGDVEEARALAGIFGDRTPVSSLKGYIGHTLGAAGSIELALSLAMMQRGMIFPTLNLEKIDPACAGVDHVTQVRPAKLDVILKNSFAFGGINAALVCRRDTVS